MNFGGLAIASTLLAVAVSFPDSAGQTLPVSKQTATRVLVTGGAHGQLSPCGCTKPMSGGLNRLGTVIRTMRTSADTWIDVGGTVQDGRRQSVLKLETYADWLGSYRVDGVMLGGQSLVLGDTMLETLRSLAHVEPVTDRSSQTIRNFRVQVVSGGSTVSPLSQLILVDMGRDAAEVIAKAHPSVLVIYDSAGSASGRDNLATPGSHLRGYVAATFAGGKWNSEGRTLEASIADDAKTSKIYATYLRRLTAAQLDRALVKTNSEGFSGSRSCTSCHTKVAASHAKTKHAIALQTLQREGHNHDPDCLSCHVTGIESTKGFRPGLERKFGEVGCESCHGPSESHARKPKNVRLGRVTEKACLSCHTPSTSPGFSFNKMWPKIKH